MIVTGDPTQIDLPPNTKSGLVEALRILDGVAGRRSPCASTTPTSCRHPLVAEIVQGLRPRRQNGARAGRRRGLIRPFRERTAPSAAAFRPMPPARKPPDLHRHFRRGRRLAAEAQAREALVGEGGRARRCRKPASTPRPARNSASSSPTIRISVRSTRAGAARTSRPTCCPFPAFPTKPGGKLPPMLGDIVLAAETVAREAELEGKPLDHHITHLVIHGVLHLLGHDHEDEGRRRPWKRWSGRAASEACHSRSLRVTGMETNRRR